jgi:hypothetical protein
MEMHRMEQGLRADGKAIMQKDQRDYSEFLRQRKDAEEQVSLHTALLLH